MATISFSQQENKEAKKEGRSLFAVELETYPDKTIPFKGIKWSGMLSTEQAKKAMAFLTDLVEEANTASPQKPAPSLTITDKGGLTSGA